MYRLKQDTEEDALELKRRINIYLSQKGVPSLHRLNIEVTDGTVTFQGRATSFYERQLCHSCKYVAGVRELVDNLQVEKLSPKISQERDFSTFGSP